eukprot:COSAG02_NODE_6629_length_3450_cov_1.931961_1_plen_870_part_00
MGADSERPVRAKGRRSSVPRTLLRAWLREGCITGSCKSRELLALSCPTAPSRPAAPPRPADGAFARPSAPSSARLLDTRISNAGVKDVILKDLDREKLKLVRNKCAEGYFCFVHEYSFYSQPLAVKELKSKCSPSEFFKETKILHQLNHPHIPRLRWIDPEHCWLGMEWVSGTTLDDCESSIREKHWPSWGTQIADALQYIHMQKILHNDLRLSNVMVTEDGQNVKLIDFGLSKLQHEDGSFSQMPSSVRSVKYKCPHAAKLGHSVLGPKVDVYSFGVCMLELATGKINHVWSTDDGHPCTDDQVHRLIIAPSTTDADLHKRLDTTSAPTRALRDLVEGCVTVEQNNRIDLNRVQEEMKRINVGPKVRFVYHVLEPQDQLEFDDSGQLQRLTRLPGGKADMPVSYHVGHGSKDEFRGPFISCTQSADWAIHFWSLQKAQSDISYPIVCIDTTKISENFLIDLTTKEAGRNRGLREQEVNYSYDASEVVFTNGYSDGIPAAAIADVFTLSQSRLPVDKSTKQWHERTAYRRKLVEMVRAAGDPKTKGYKDWYRHYNHVCEKDMNGANTKEILAEGRCSNLALRRREADPPKVSGEQYARDVWLARDGPYVRCLEQQAKKRPRSEGTTSGVSSRPVVVPHHTGAAAAGGASLSLGSQVVGRFYQPSTGQQRLTLFIRDGDVVYDARGSPKKLSQASNVVDSAGIIVGKGPSAVFQKWRWKLNDQTGETFKKKGIRWQVRKKGRKLLGSKLPLGSDAVMIKEFVADSHAQRFAEEHTWLRPGRLLCEIDGSSEKCVDFCRMFMAQDREGYKKVMYSATHLTFCEDEQYAGAEHSTGPTISTVPLPAKSTNALKRPHAPAITGFGTSAKRTKP